MSDSERQDESVFGEEDNNPFPHTSGLASLVQSLNEHLDPSNATDDTSVSPDNVAENAHSGDDLGDDDDESLLLYRNDRTENEQFNTIHINYESRVTKLLAPDSNARIDISEAGKSNEGMANSLRKYVVYTIKLINGDNAKEEIQTRRRYSDFESLRDVLTRVFPLVLIPPIPPKNYFSLNMLNGLVGSNIATNGAPANTASSVTVAAGENSNGLGATYSYINSNHLNKNRLIEHRKRLLSNFLNNCLHIPQIRNLEFFAKFLDPSANWTDEIALISSQLPKSVYQLNPENGLHTDALYVELPLPVSNHPISTFLRPLKGNKKKLAQKTNKLLGSSEPPATDTVSPTNGEASAETGSVVKTSHLDAINKKIMDNFIGLSNDYVELGTVLNSFFLMMADSLKARPGQSDEDDIKVDVIFDKMGVAFDRSYITINTLIGELETKFSEPLGEAVQYSSILHTVTKYHERKLKQKELLDTDINEKRKELAELMRAELEATKVETAINSQVLQNKPNYDLTSTTSPKSNAKLKLFPSMNSLKKITKYVSDIMDQNPEVTRKQKVTQLQERIGTLEKCQTIMLEDISYITDELDKSFKNFHTRELKIIYLILLGYNGILVSWAKKNIEIWEEIKDEIVSL